MPFQTQEEDDELIDAIPVAESVARTHDLKTRLALALRVTIRAVEDCLLDHAEFRGLPPVAFEHDWRVHMEQRLLRAASHRGARAALQHECRNIHRRLKLKEPHLLPFTENGLEEIHPAFQGVMDAVFRRMLRRLPERERVRRARDQDRLGPARQAVEDEFESLLRSRIIAPEALKEFFRTPMVREGFRKLFPPRDQRAFLLACERRLPACARRPVVLLRPAHPLEVPPVLSDEAAHILDEIRCDALRFTESPLISALKAA